MADETKTILDLEKKRCDAIETGNADILGSILSDDYTHVHMTGKLDDRQGHIDAVTARPRKPVRGDLNVRFFENAAVITGTLDNHMGGPENKITRAYCHQVLIKTDGQWRFVSVQLTPMKDGN